MSHLTTVNSSGGGDGGVSSVSGTANRITSTGGATPVIDIAATYVGQSSITTLGTVGTGTWQGTAVGPTFGGTGLTSYASGDLIYASATNTLSKLAKPSFPGQLLVEDGTTPIYYNPLNQFIIDDEFCAGDGNSTFIFAGGGSGGTATQSTFGDNAHPGVWGIYTNGIGGNFAIRKLDRFFYLGGGQVILQIIAKIPNLSDATDRFGIRLGFADDLTGPANGVFFSYQDNANSGKWECNTASSASTTATDSGITTDTNWHNYTIIINSNASSVTFYIDGSLVSTNTTNIPSSVLNLGISNVNSGISAGNTRYVYLDRLYMYQKLTSLR